MPSRFRALLGLSLVLVLATSGCGRLADWMIGRSLRRVDRSVLESPDLTIVLCGTGSPIADRSRAGACTAVIAGGEMFLVDVGPGSWKTVDLANLPTEALSGILLTHFHSDHIGDLGEAVTQSWIAGRSHPLDVYGPTGVGLVVTGFRFAYSADVRYRVTHHGEQYMPHIAGIPVPHEVTLGDDPAASAVVLQRNGLTITMFRVDHRPVEPAVGYRFDYHGRSVVVSGDTKRSDSLVQHAKGADVLIHEALQPAMMTRVASVARTLGRDRLAKMALDTIGYHTSPADAAAVARDAGVHRLVLTHMVPPPNSFLARRLFTQGMGGIFSGEITLGEDGMRIALPPRS